MNRRLATAMLAVVLAAAGLTNAASRDVESRTIGLARLLSAHQLQDVVVGIATFEEIPSRNRVRALQGLGLVVQPMERLPLALVRGPLAALRAAVRSGRASDVYANERIELLDKTSTDAMGTASLRAKGLTGKGVTVAVVDSGCDASHPDLADHVVHNVKLISAEYLNLRPDSSNTLVIPFETGPYQNSDLGSGHGTHVSGIIAADGTADPTHLGVAPDADLVCYSIGEVLFTTAVVTAYDHLLRQPNLWGVDVINNSWGNSFQMFDPAHPVHVATKAVAELGVFVAFAAGNSGDTDAEASLNPFSSAPWVMSVAASDVKRIRASFSSNGFRFDNARPLNRGPDGHRGFRKYRMGMYHPDITSPGDGISSTCDSAGTLIGPCPPGENATASGTSMASPHIAGAAAVLLQANPQLNHEQIRQALQATAIPVFAEQDGKRRTLGFWQAGYGFADLNAAVRLATSRNWAEAIAEAQRRADARVMRSVGFSVPSSDLWTWDAPRVALGGSDTRIFRVGVAKSITHLKVTVSHPSLAVIGGNFMTWSAVVRDAAGRELGRTTEATLGAGTASLFLDLRAIKGLRYGAFEIEAIGDMAASDPDTLDSESLLGRVIVLQVAQLARLR